MDKRIKELAEQLGFQKNFLGNGYIVRDQELERFAELVLQNYISQIMTTEDRERFIREDEREACAKLCESKLQQTPYGGLVAAAIRARSEPSPAFKNYMGDNWAGIV